MYDQPTSVESTAGPGGPNIRRALHSTVSVALWPHSSLSVEDIPGLRARVIVGKFRLLYAHWRKKISKRPLQMTRIVPGEFEQLAYPLVVGKNIGLNNRAIALARIEI
ncbi:hypothetical protein T265_10650 [Opisthorchis viverrini]|uniref:Uncharacterized protein n=1 Tax=Opisthorchis viverrini TaxID=6198 RepID=A0A074Z1H0_OPIVI|nr:hypothetical protein T265_10650 [Opisthorchis viverrini]KER20901.1 hypothetical protein T265_10650 [Opisthorchis viverrini]